MRNSNLRSLCCKAELITESSDEGTSFYRCSKCKKACDFQVINDSRSPFHGAGTHLYFSGEQSMTKDCSEKCVDQYNHPITQPELSPIDEKKLRNKMKRRVKFLAKTLKTDFRTEVSKILVKWGMSTKQAAITEIVRLHEKNSYSKEKK